MGLEPKLFQKLSQQLVMTPQLRQAIKILQVSRTELDSLIETELEENPVLEEGAAEKPAVELDAEEPRVDGVMGEAEPAAEAPKPEAESAKDLKEIDWGDYFETYGNEFHGTSPNDTDPGDDDRRPSLENVLSKTQDLVGHLEWQVRMSTFRPEEERIAGLIIGNVDSDGYLGASVEEIASIAGVEPAAVEAVLAKLQEFDPPGVCARDLRECLLTQLRQLGAAESLAARIVRGHLEALESRRFEKLARDLGVPVETVVAASRVVASLEPKPGRNFGEDEARYVTPDVFVTKVGDEYVINLNDDGLPYLRVSNYYRRMLGSDPSGEAKGYIQEKMRAASWLIKSIQQRQRTIYLVTQSIVKFQRDFFERGIAGLKPLVLKDVANDIGMHESTVSRATSSKYVHTPQGTFELKFFFTSSLRAGAGEDVSSESVKQRIREIIHAEDGRRPYSDQYIAAMLAKENVDIARRTVAKYREMMGILPSSKRKQPY
ncbi:MAG: RNA polymerase factor sigma-54 [Deltaproteobacteria bacterium]|nr:RNA polymerase factor sigma-54 [Deltaproteobacteria bacterium]